MSDISEELVEKATKYINEVSYQKYNIGFDFNIFSILRKPTEEVNLHSKFIYHLLIQDDSHPLCKKYFNLFCNALNEYYNIGLLDDNNDVLEVERVEREYKLDKGFGQVDLYFKFENGFEVIIENKIQSDESGDQLEKYLEYIEGKGVIIYLDLKGKSPKKKYNPKVVFVVDYSFIVSWIKKCIDITLIKHIKYNIIQYRDLLVHNKMLLGKKYLLKGETNMGFVGKDEFLKAKKISDAYIIQSEGIRNNFWDKLIFKLDELSSLISNKKLFEYGGGKHWNVSTKKAINWNNEKYFDKENQNLVSHGVCYEISQELGNENLFLFLESNSGDITYSLGFLNKINEILYFDNCNVIHKVIRETVGGIGMLSEEEMELWVCSFDTKISLFFDKNSNFDCLLSEKDMNDCIDLKIIEPLRIMLNKLNSIKL